MSAAQLREALDTLPDSWREVLLRHDAAPAERVDNDDSGTQQLGLSPTQERDVLARARAALRDALDAKERS